MKNLKIILFLQFTVLFTVTGFSQRSFTGHVVEIIDGSTFVLEVDGGKLTGSLQYVEVPEPEQPLNRIIRDHLRGLILGKTVNFLPNGFTTKAAVGKMYLNGVDIGAQLLRDGAAWHVPMDKSGQEPVESAAYENNQNLAKAEKRGIWSIAHLTPAWEFRAGRERAFGSSEATSNTAGEGSEKKNYHYDRNDSDMWVDVGGEVLTQKNSVGTMFSGYDPEKKIRSISTPSVAQTIENGDKRLELEIRLFFFEGELRNRLANTAFVIGWLATSKQHNFEIDNKLTFIADGETLEVAQAQRFWREGSSSVQELLQYKISRSTLSKIANARFTTVKLGRFNGLIDPEVRDTITKLLAASN